MPDEQEFTFQIPNFHAGVHTCPDYRNRPVNSLTKAKNAVLTDCGLITRRTGYTIVGSADTDIASELAHYQDIRQFGSTIYALRHISTGLLELRYLSSGVWTDPSTNETATTDYGRIGSIEYARESDGTNYGYVANGNTVLKINLSTNSMLELTDDNTKPPPNSNCQAYFNGRNWYGVSDILHFSKVDEPETHERLLDLIRVLDRGQQIRALVPWKDESLMIFTNNAIFQLIVGASQALLDWSLIEVTKSVGCWNTNAATVAHDDIYFLSRDSKVYSLKKLASSLSAGVHPVPESYPVSDEIGALNRIDFIFSCVEYHDNSIYVCGTAPTSSGDYTSKMYQFDTRFRAWTGPHTVYASDVADDSGAIINVIRSIPRETEATYYFGPNIYLGMYIEDATDGNAGRVMRLDIEGDSNTYIPEGNTYVDTIDTQTKSVRFEIITRPHDFGHAHQEKSIRWVEVEYGDEANAMSANGSFTFYAKRIEDAAWTSFGTESYTTSTTFNKVKFDGLRSLKRGKVFQFRIVDDSASDGPKIRGMWVNFFGDALRDER